MVYTRRIKNDAVDYINGKLIELCNKNHFAFIDNSNIGINDLCKDGLHLDLTSKQLIFDNYFNFLGNFLYQDYLN